MRLRMKLSGVYAITDETLLPDDRLLAAVADALAAGISLLQYRSKRLQPRLQQRQVANLLELCRRYQVPLLINDDIDLCLATGADGVHLGQQDANPLQARQLLGPRALIGVSCHADLGLARRARQQGADYVAFGRFYPSFTKPQAPAAPLSVLTAARRELDIPVVAIGGLNAENGAAAIAAGADMLAVIHAVFAGPDVSGQARALVELFRQQPSS